MEIKIKFENKKELENRIDKLADMLCFLKGYKTCLELNDDYSNQLEYVFENMEFIRDINIKLKDLYGKSKINQSAELLTQRVVLQDLNCDCIGEAARSVANTLKTLELDPSKEYIIQAIERSGNAKNQNPT